jgi:hypothetical protein
LAPHENSPQKTNSWSKFILTLSFALSFFWLKYFSLANLSFCLFLYCRSIEQQPNVSIFNCLEDYHNHKLQSLSVFSILSYPLAERFFTHYTTPFFSHKKKKKNSNLTLLTSLCVSVSTYNVSLSLSSL